MSAQLLDSIYIYIYNANRIRPKGSHTVTQAKKEISNAFWKKKDKLKQSVNSF